MKKFMNQEGFDQNLAYNLIEATPTQAHLKLKIQDKHLNVHAYLHGGVYYGLSDAAAGFIVREIEGNWVTLNSSFNYLKAAKEGTIDIHAKRISKTSKLTVIEVNTYQDEIHLTTGTFTMYRI